MCCFLASGSKKGFVCIYTGWWHRSSEDWAMSNLAQMYHLSFCMLFVWHIFSSMSPITWHRYIFHVATYLSKIINFKASKLYSSRLFWKLRYFRPLFDPWARDKISKFSGTLLPAPTCCGPALGWQTANFHDMWRERKIDSTKSKVKLPETPLILAGALGGPSWPQLTTGSTSGARFCSSIDKRLQWLHFLLAVSAWESVVQKWSLKIYSGTCCILTCYRIWYVCEKI